MLQASPLPDHLRGEAALLGNLLERQLLGVLVENLARDQRPQGVFTEYQRHGEVRQPRAVARLDHTALGQGVGHAGAGFARSQAERTPTGNRLGLGVQETPERLGVDALT